MSGANIQEEHVSGVFCHNLHNMSFTSMLNQYQKMLSSLYGPKGRQILVRNSAGRDTLIFSSSEITKQLPFSHPVVKYINALISAQNMSYGHYGLYTGIVCARLLEEALSCEIDTPHYIITEVSEWITSRLLGYISKFPEQVITDLDIGDIQQVTAFVKTILGSKNYLNPYLNEIDDMSIQIMKAFLKTIPEEESSSSRFGHVIISQEGPSDSKPQVFDGFLYRESDIDSDFLRKLTLLPKDIKVLLFSVPLMPDKNISTLVHWKGKLSKEECFINETVSCLLHYMKLKNITILANQKPIHPIIKYEIERKGYVVLERLGTIATDALMKISGCQAIVNLCELTKEMSHTKLGQLLSLEHFSSRGKNFILFKNELKCVSTLLLPAVSPSIEGIFKDTVESSLSALKTAAVDGKIIAGGGCLESWIATQIHHLVSINLDHLISQNEVPNHHIIKVANNFIRVFMELAVQLAGGASTTKFDWCVDSIYHHLWPYNSNMIDKESSISLIPREFISQFDYENSYRCVCGLLTDEVIRQKHGKWELVDFQLSFDVAKPSVSEKSCFCEISSMVDYNEGEVNDRNSRITEALNITDDPEIFGVDLDSLDGKEKANTEEDVDSLEKTINSAEEEFDSLEGRLEDVDDDVDSLDDILDKMVEPLQSNKNKSKLIFNPQIQNVLYDSYLAKYNALRLAVEGFAQLFQIGQCVYDK